MQGNQIRISKNFWAELEARGFLDRKNVGGSSLLDFYGSIQKGADGEYIVVNENQRALIFFVNSEAFLKALRMTEQKVKYRLFY